jgi:hypothetical protein
VTDTEGAPLPAATVRALGADSEALGTATPDDEGQFTLDSRRPVWLRVDASGYTSRVLAADPGSAHEVTLAPAAGRATLTFGGDTMFARRFRESGTDPLNQRTPISPADSLAGHRRILAGVEPLLSAADATSVNLETPLTTSRRRHPSKLYAYASHPVAARALADAGVDYAALGNNHAFDALTPGLEDTLANLDDAGLTRSGAGLSPTAAWEPAVVDAGPLQVAYLSCTTVTGRQYDLHWAADEEGARRTADVDGRTVTVPTGPGVAEAAVEDLDTQVRRATERADVVVVQIHGGDPYRPAPTERMRTLTETAARAGADVVANHHPHVVGGIETLGSTLVAWSLGNFVFDQKIWPTFPTYLLTVEVTADGVDRVHVHPLLIDRFVPHGVVGKPNDHVAHRTAGQSTAAVRRTRSGLVVVPGDVPPRERERLTLSGPEADPDSGAETGSGSGPRSGTGTGTETGTEAPVGRLYERRTGWVSAVAGGEVRLGRDRLPTGTFESVDVDGTGYDGPLWRFGRDARPNGPAFGHAESGGIRLERVSGNSSRAILSNTRRIPVDGPLTLTCRYRTAASDGATLETSWYADTADPRFARDEWSLDATGGDWRLLRRELSVPSGATHLNVLFALEPPGGGRRSLFLDDVRLISWAPPGTTGGRAFDHLRVAGDATVVVTRPARADGVGWRPLA